MRRVNRAARAAPPAIFKADENIRRVQHKSAVGSDRKFTKVPHQLVCTVEKIQVQDVDPGEFYPAMAAIEKSSKLEHLAVNLTRPGHKGLMMSRRWTIPRSKNIIGRGFFDLFDLRCLGITKQGKAVMLSCKHNQQEQWQAVNVKGGTMMLKLQERTGERIAVPTKNFRDTKQRQRQFWHYRRQFRALKKRLKAQGLTSPQRLKLEMKKIINPVERAQGRLRKKATRAEVCLAGKPGKAVTGVECSKASRWRYDPKSGHITLDSAPTQCVTVLRKKTSGTNHRWVFGAITGVGLRKCKPRNRDQTWGPTGQKKLAVRFWHSILGRLAIMSV